ncbi:hypothetical protein B7494_g7930 [Chlorociboria aeruginascens]|nr:hypothetical protein B7494_g7930 [Chlorociboria aeruginascens]
MYRNDISTEGLRQGGSETHPRRVRAVLEMAVGVLICWFEQEIPDPLSHSNSYFTTYKPFIIAIAVFCLWQIFQLDFAASRILPIIQKKVNRPVSRIAKVTVAANSLNSSVIHHALRTHKVQDDLHGYKSFIATNELVGDISEVDHQKRPRGAWSKPAYLLSIVVNELAKPECDRLEWIFWFDADTVVMNPQTPLEVFLPPKNNSELSTVHLLMGSNMDGLNSGAFALRIHPWTVSLLSGVLAYPLFFDSKLQTDRFRDQSAFVWLLEGPDSPLAERSWLGRNHWDHWVVIPMRWFNSFPFNNPYNREEQWILSHNMTNATFDNGTDKVYDDGQGGKVQPWKVMQGDMLVHFAGTGGVRDSWMGPWIERAEAYLPQWSNATTKEVLKIEAENFWNDRAEDIRRGKEEEKAESTQDKEKEEGSKFEGSPPPSTPPPPSVVVDPEPGPPIPSS